MASLELGETRVARRNGLDHPDRCPTVTTRSLQRVRNAIAQTRKQLCGILVRGGLRVELDVLHDSDRYETHVSPHFKCAPLSLRELVLLQPIACYFWQRFLAEFRPTLFSAQFSNRSPKHPKGACSRNDMQQFLPHPFAILRLLQFIHKEPS